MRPLLIVRGREDRPGQVIVGTDWIPAPGSRLYRAVSPDSRAVDNGVRISESQAIKQTLDLIQSGYISRVLPCRCGKFFFQKFSHQRFCGGKCRVAEFRTSDEARRKRNEYARKLYHLHKSGKVK